MRVQYKVRRVFVLARFTGELCIVKVMQMTNRAARGKIQINFILGTGIILDAVCVLTDSGVKFLTAYSEGDCILALT